MWFLLHSSHLKKVVPPLQSPAKSSSKRPESLHPSADGRDAENHGQMLRNSGSPAKEAEERLEESEGSVTSQKYGPQN